MKANEIAAQFAARGLRNLTPKQAGWLFDQAQREHAQNGVYVGGGSTFGGAPTTAKGTLPSGGKWVAVRGNGRCAFAFPVVQPDEDDDRAYDAAIQAQERDEARRVAAYKAAREG